MAGGRAAVVIVPEGGRYVDRPGPVAKLAPGCEPRASEKGALVPSRTRPIDLLLFLHALRLCRSARGTGSQSSLLQQSAALSSKPGLPDGVAPDAAYRATLHASRRAARWFRSRDTCLIRALVTGALLADRNDVLIHVGFATRAQSDEVLDGHAWVTVDGVIVGEPDPVMADDRFGIAFSIPVRRHRPPEPSSPIGDTIASP